jgi:hypothetical protein
MTTNQDRYAGEKPATEITRSLALDWHWNPKTQRYTRLGKLAWIIYRLFHPRFRTWFRT